VAATMLVVIAGWVLFRSPTPGRALALYAGMIGLHGLGPSAAFGWQAGGLERILLAFALLAVYAGPWLARRLAPSSLPPLAARAVVVPLFVLALLRTAAVSFAPFLYFQF